MENPEAALAQLDIVVNLSRFQESFGRTVLEAMAAARPVVAYDWGALGELVVAAENGDATTGILVPFGDSLMAAQQVAMLVNDPTSAGSQGSLLDTVHKRALAPLSYARL